jgi:septal ring factor EnvC (AmiA/AmiB activator)
VTHENKPAGEIAEAIEAIGVSPSNWYAERYLITSAYLTIFRTGGQSAITKAATIAAEHEAKLRAELEAVKVEREAARNQGECYFTYWKEQEAGRYAAETKLAELQADNARLREQIAAAIRELEMLQEKEEQWQPQWNNIAEANAAGYNEAKAEIAAAVAAEREACHKRCEEIAKEYSARYRGLPPYDGKQSGYYEPGVDGIATGAGLCADAIAARSESEPKP